MKGQALITLLFISVIGITIATGAVMMVVINAQSGLSNQQGSIAYEIAESGAENALLRILRDPAYAGETNLTIGSGTVDIQVSSNSGVFIATSSGKIGNYVRKVQLTSHFTPDYVLVIDSKKEIF